MGLVAVFVDRVERAGGWSDRVSVRHGRVHLPSPQTRLVRFRRPSSVCVSEHPVCPLPTCVCFCMVVCVSHPNMRVR